MIYDQLVTLAVQWLRDDPAAAARFRESRATTDNEWLVMCESAIWEALNEEHR